MQHEMMRHPAPPPGADNVGDVLASIRQLIAQDGVGDRIPDQALNALNALNAQDIAPRIRASVAVTPLVLDSGDLIAAPMVAPEPEPVIAPDRAEGQGLDDWFRLPSTEPRDPFSVATEPRTEPEEAVSAQIAPSPSADSEPPRIQPFGPFLEAAAPTTVQMEETMLHVNASVTPINPTAEAQAVAEMLGRESEPHLFAPQGKDAQKGTHLRGMIREAIRQELQGEIGTRLSRNLQEMIRHEIELTLRQMCEQE